jgi:uncharacterized protein involved in type VI secretion and phage assembly
MSREEIYPGAVIGVVKEVDGALGRVKVDFPWLNPPQRSDWASIAAPMAGGERGVYFMPEENDEVLVVFLHGKLTHPYVVGFLWNGQHQPPSTDPNLRIIHSRNGHKISLYDPAPGAGDNGYLRVEDADGNHIELKNGVRVEDANGNYMELKNGVRVEDANGNYMELKNGVRVGDASGNQIELTNGMVTILSTGLLRFQASAVQINSRVVAPAGPPI